VSGNRAGVKTSSNVNSIVNNNGSSNVNRVNFIPKFRQPVVSPFCLIMLLVFLSLFIFCILKTLA